MLDISNLYDPNHIIVLHHVNNAPRPTPSARRDATTRL